MFNPSLAMVIFTLIVNFLNVIHALPLPRNVSSFNHGVHKATAGNLNNVHNVHVIPVSSDTAVPHVSLGDRHRRDMESGYNFKDDAGEPVAARHEFDSDIDGKRDPVFDELFDSELELEVDPTQPAVDDELSRFNNALEQALDYLSEMESSVVEFSLENAHPVTAVEL